MTAISAAAVARSEPSATMPARVWITRASPGAQATARRLHARGFTGLIAPVLEVRPLTVQVDLTGVEALAFTSANAVSVFAAACRDRSLPVLTVGDATAKAALKAGFGAVRSARGDLGSLADLICAEAADRTILHPVAADPAGDLAGLVGDRARVRSLAVYETVATGTPAPQAWDGVLIHSPRAAAALGSRVSDVSRRFACAISQAAARPLAELGFGEIRIAATPDEAALLDTLGKPGPDV